MKIVLNTPSEFWPRCFYDKEKYCGEPSTRELGGPTDLEMVGRSWHVADMCECPSCPLRCAIRDARIEYEHNV